MVNIVLDHEWVVSGVGGCYGAVLVLDEGGVIMCLGLSGAVDECGGAISLLSHLRRHSNINKLPR